MNPARGANGGPDDAGAATEAPHGVTLTRHAQIAAEIAEGDRPIAAVLGERGLSDCAWTEASIYWMGRIGDDAALHGASARMAGIYSAAFAEAQAAIKPVPPMDPVSWAVLTVEIQRLGAPARPLGARGLSTADYLRLARHFATALSSDPVAAKEFADAYEALQPPGAAIG